MSRFQRAAALTAALLAVLFVGAWLAVPPLLKWQAQSRLSEWLGRAVTVGEVGFRPWRLEFTFDDVAVGAASGSAAPGAAAARPASGAAGPALAAASAAAPLLQLARVRADLAFWPLFRGLPVVEALEFESPRLAVARLAPGHYDVDDLIDRFSRGADEPAAQPTRFALYNLQVRDAQVRFDDRPLGRLHAVDALQLALPFLSNLPEKVEVTVEPRLAFKLNGVPFDSAAQATPFAPTQHAVLQLKMAELDLGPYLAYLPRSQPVRPTRGVVSAELALEFTRPPGAAPAVALRGWLAARDLDLVGTGGAPLAGWRKLHIGLRDVQPLARRLDFDTLRIDGAQVHLARDAAGRFNPPWGVSAAAAPAAAPAAQGGGAASPAAVTGAASAAAAARPAARPWQISLQAVELADARLLWNDATVRPAVALQFDALTFSAKPLHWPMARPAAVSLTATLRAQADKSAPAGRLAAHGSASDREARLDLEIADLALETLAPYLAQALVPSVQGRLSGQGRLDWSAGAAAPGLQIAIDQARLDALRVLSGSGRAVQESAALGQLAVADVRLDIAARSATLGSVKLLRPSLLLERDRQGRFNVAQWLRPAPAAAGKAAGRPPAQAREPPWRWQLSQLQVQDGRVQLSDAFVRRDVRKRPWRAELNQLQLGLQGLSWLGDHATRNARLALSARVAGPATAQEKAPPAGTVDWKGEVGMRPLQASGQVRVVRFPVHLFAVHFSEPLPVSLLRAEAGYAGSLALREQADGLTVAAAGDVLLGDVHVTTLAGSAADPATLATGADDLLSWQSLALKGVKFALKPGTPTRLEVGEAALTDFYSRLVITEQGRFNLQDLGAPAAPTAPASAASAAAAADPAPAGLPLDFSIGATRLSDGRIDFSDHYIRPNYSAALTELQGELGPFSSTSREMAKLQLRGRAAGTALLDISGRINPMAEPLALDIKARATDLELAPLSPYAAKYAGYAIERGKLSLDVTYKIDADGKLQASNQLVLNQLTFGERIESPSATKLPVLLAVALLKDRHGVIDINLPISGSVNDPEFSVGGIIFKLIVNLIGKALTAPFSLLFGGGGGEDLSFVDFQLGTALAVDAGALDKVAQALQDRPGLQLTVTATADLAAEREAYQRLAIDGRLLAERRREGLRAGAAASAPVTLGADDRARLLKALYRRTDLPDKPRNVLGLVQDIPAPEMEALLRKHVPVTAETMHELALQRGLAVRDALVAKGLASERIFVAAPKVHVAGADAAAWTPRVQLTLAMK